MRGVVREGHAARRAGAGIRIALIREQLAGLPSFPATDKRKDPRFEWFTENYGKRCWEIDALDPNMLRACVEEEIKSLIEPDAWQRCRVVEKAERDSLVEVMRNWAGRSTP